MASFSRKIAMAKTGELDFDVNAPENHFKCYHCGNYLPDRGSWQGEGDTNVPEHLRHKTISILFTCAVCPASYKERIWFCTWAEHERDPDTVAFSVWKRWFESESELYRNMKRIPGWLESYYPNAERAEQQDPFPIPSANLVAATQDYGEEGDTRVLSSGERRLSHVPEVARFIPLPEVRSPNDYLKEGAGKGWCYGCGKQLKSLRMTCDNPLTVPLTVAWSEWVFECDFNRGEGKPRGCDERWAKVFDEVPFGDIVTKKTAHEEYWDARVRRHEDANCMPEWFHQGNSSSQATTTYLQDPVCIDFTWDE